MVLDMIFVVCFLKRCFIFTKNGLNHPKKKKKKKKKKRMGLMPKIFQVLNYYFQNELDESFSHFSSQFKKIKEIEREREDIYHLTN